MDWQLAGTVIFTGIVIVFVALFFLIAICYLTGAIFKSLDRSGQARTQKKTASPPVAAPATPEVQAAVPCVEDGIEEETVAAIMAAIAVVMGGDVKNYSVKSIRRSSVGRPVWAQAGLADNTRPF